MIVVNGTVQGLYNTSATGNPLFSGLLMLVVLLILFCIGLINFLWRQHVESKMFLYAENWNRERKIKRNKK